MRKGKFIGWCVVFIVFFIAIMTLFTIDWNNVEGAEKRRAVAPAHTIDVKCDIEEEAAVNTAIIEKVNNQNRKSRPHYRYIKGCKLSKKVQQKIFRICQRKKISFEFVMAVIKKESGWDTSCVSDKGQSIGLMQVQKRWHGKLMDKLDCNNLYDPIQNVKVGTSILAAQFKEYKEPEWVLMAYNGGPAYAKRMIKNGITSEYAKVVMETAERYERRNN